MFISIKKKKDSDPGRGGRLADKSSGGGGKEKQHG